MTEPAIITITRKELYERIWAESVAYVAPKLGVWPTRLSNVCMRNRIPVPDRLYWQCSRSERKAVRTPLPDPDQDWPISITPTKSGRPIPEAKGQYIPEVIVPERMPKLLHPLVRAAMQSDASGIGEHGRRIHPEGILEILVSEACLKRACRILDALFKACESRGWSVRIPREYRAKAVVSVTGCEAEVWLFEGLRQEPRELSDLDRSLLESGIRRRMPYDLQPSGQLRIRASGVVDWWHTAQWGDKKRQRLEDMLDHVMAWLESVPEERRKEEQAQAQAEARRREEERLRQEQEERQRERAQRRRTEQARVDTLFADAENWDQSRKVRAFIDAWIVKKEAESGAKFAVGSEEEKWVAWARAQADRHDPLVGTSARDLDDELDSEPPPERRKSFAEFMNSLGERTESVDGA